MKESLIIAGMMLLTMGIMSAVVMVWHARVKKRSRLPLDFKLLRVPGETLRRKLQKMDEDIWYFLLVASIAPFMAAGLGTAGVVYLWPAHGLLASGVGLALYLVGIVIASMALIRKVIQRRSWLLGYLGERLVGEHLSALQQEGYHVFHDVPAESSDRKFNIDHIVIGRPGVFVIETKSRRKGAARPGLKEHEVTFDGQQLIWPWGEEIRSLRQAVNLSRWADEWLHKMTGLAIASEPVLAVPGWYVTNKAKGPPRVLNEKQLAAAICGFKREVLTAEQVALLVRQLDARCRDVED